MRENRELLNALFRAQGGVATFDQALGLGCSSGAMRRRLRTGDLFAVHPGVLQPAGVPITWTTEFVAAALFLGDRAVASHAMAARLLGFTGFENDHSIEFTSLRQNRGIGGRVTVHSARRLDHVDVTTFRIPFGSKRAFDPRLVGVSVLERLSVTTPARTIIDLSRRLRVDPLARLVDDSISRRLLTVRDLCDRLDALRDCGVRGVRRLDQVLVDAGVESWLERKFLELVRAAGLPQPRCQVVFKAGSKTIARVDFLFDGTDVIVEVSGRRGHVTDAERQKDARRRNELQQAGMEVMEFITDDVVRDPEYVLRTLRLGLRRAGLTV